MSDRKMCKCSRCDYTWPEGFAGDHSCAEELEKTVKFLKKEVKHYENGDEKVECVICSKEKWETDVLRSDNIDGFFCLDCRDTETTSCSKCEELTVISDLDEECVCDFCLSEDDEDDDVYFNDCVEDVVDYRDDDSDSEDDIEQARRYV